VAGRVLIDQSVRDAIEGSDTDALLVGVDRMCEGKAWQDLVDLRGLLAEAGTRGKQLWGIDENIRYRMALEAPGAWAGPVLNEGAARHTLGPLPEVAASTHDWAELDPHLAPGPIRAVFAQERVIRGEDLEGAEVDRHLLEIPLKLARWEPEYQYATYHPDRVETPPPLLPPMAEVEPRSDPDRSDRRDLAAGRPFVATALASLAATWVDESNGRCLVVAAEGGVDGAMAVFGLRRAMAAEISPATGFAWMAWAAASGGAYGRRKGAAAGRFAAWWAAAAVSDLEFPCAADELGNSIAGLRWFAWSDLAADTGWSFRLAIHDPDEKVTWAISAGDAV
jgi:hypothetical protein